MANRPSFEPDQPLSPEHLARRQRELSLLSGQHVAAAYKLAHEACQMKGDRVPKANVIQELVTVWKVLRKMGTR